MLSVLLSQAVCYYLLGLRFGRTGTSASISHQVWNTMPSGSLTPVSIDPLTHYEAQGDSEKYPSQGDRLDGASTVGCGTHPHLQGN